MITSRRSFLTGLGAALVVAPAIVRAGSLMPVKQMVNVPRQYGMSASVAWGEALDAGMFGNFPGCMLVRWNNQFNDFGEWTK